MSTHDWVGIAAALVAFTAMPPYARSILRGETKPARVTWFIWAVVGTMLFTSYWASGARATAWVALIYGLNPAIIFILSIKHGVGGHSRLDIFCLAGAVVGLIVWIITDMPQLALGINISIDLLGLLPTIKKTWLAPGTENKPAWVLFSIANAINWLAVDRFTPSVVAYPVYGALCSVTMMYLLFWPRRAHRASGAG